MQRTITIKLNPTAKKKLEIIATMVEYRVTVNKFLKMFAKYKYLDKLNYKYLYNPRNKNIKIASNYSTNALAYAVTLLNARLDLICKNCKVRIFANIQDKAERHYLFYLLKNPKYVQSLMLKKQFIVDKEFKISKQKYLNIYLHRILRHEFKNNKVPKLNKLVLRTDVVTANLQEYKNHIKFNYILKLSTINKGSRVIIPFNINKWAKKFFVKRKGCYILCFDDNNDLCLHIPIKEKEVINNKTGEIGIDKGFRTLLTDSNKKLYGENWNKIELELDHKFQKKQKPRNKLYCLKKVLYNKWNETKNEQIYKKIKNLEKFNLGKIKFNNNKVKTKETIKNNVNKTVNTFISENPNLKTIVLEKLNSFNKDKKYNSRSRRILNNWKKGFLEKKIIFISQLNSIELAYQNAAYTSQTCPNCDYISKENRHNEEFTCIKCGFSEHADVVGALNILKRKYDSEIGLFTTFIKVKEILLKRYSIGDIKPPGLETLNSDKSYESCKQSIQENKLKLETVKECDSAQS